MNKPSTRALLRSKVQARQGLLVPGAFNALSARVVADMGFEAVYLSGAGLTNMLYGLPDLAFIGLQDVAQATAAIRGAVDIPLIVDADTGFGNALNVAHTVKVLERAGADALQLEDQVDLEAEAQTITQTTMEMLSKGTLLLEALVMDLEVQEILHTHTGAVAVVLVELVELAEMELAVDLEELVVRIVLMEQIFTGLEAAEVAAGPLLEALVEQAVEEAEQVLLLALEDLV